MDTHPRSRRFLFCSAVSLSHPHTLSLLRWHPPASCHCLSINSCNHIHRQWTQRRALCREHGLLTLSADCWFHGLKWQPPLADSISWACEVMKKKHTVFTYEVNKACVLCLLLSRPLPLSYHPDSTSQGGDACKGHPACHALIINNNKRQLCSRKPLKRVSSPPIIMLMPCIYSLQQVVRNKTALAPLKKQALFIIRIFKIIEYLIL